MTSFVAESTNTGQTTLEGGGEETGDEAAAKNVTSFQRTMTKKVVGFWRKNGVTPSVAAPHDTNLSDATVKLCCISAVHELGWVDPRVGLGWVGSRSFSFHWAGAG